MLRFSVLDQYFGYDCLVTFFRFVSRFCCLLFGYLSGERRTNDPGKATKLELS